MKHVIETNELSGSANWLTTRFEELTKWAVKVTGADKAVNWSRANSLWPMPFGTACCAIEFMATAASRFDFARFGMERQAFSPRQADVLICAGRLPFKLAPVIRRVYDQMPQPKWVISMGACASTGGIFDNYAMVQGIDTIVPVDVYVPGCPPRPEGLLYGVLLLHKKIKGESLFDRAARREPLRRGPASDLRQRDRPRGRVVRGHDRPRRPHGAPRGDGLAARHPGAAVRLPRRRHRRGVPRPGAPARAGLQPALARAAGGLASEGRARPARRPDGRLDRPAVAGRRLAGARGLRHVRRRVPRPSRPAAHPDVGDVRRRPPAAQRLPAARPVQPRGAGAPGARREPRGALLAGGAVDRRRVRRAAARHAGAAAPRRARQDPPLRMSKRTVDLALATPGLD